MEKLNRILILIWIVFACMLQLVCALFSLYEMFYKLNPFNAIWAILVVILLEINIWRTLKK